MNRTLRIGGLALAAAAALVACSGAAGGPASSPSGPAGPSTGATPTPIATPTPVPTATPIVSPSAPAGPILVALRTATGHRVSIEMIDEHHHVVAARSGQPGDGASVPLGTVEAKNLDPRTVRFTWSDTPGDAELGLYVSEDAGHVLVIRPERPAGDSIAFDRVLIVEFDRPVDAATLQLGIQEGLDTLG